MTSKFITDLRKLVDKPQRVEVTIVDKSPIPSSRGIDSFLEELVNHKDYEGTYDMEELIDGVRGPRLADETTEIWDHVARITGMTDPDFPDLTIKLKPNGEFDT